MMRSGPASSQARRSGATRRPNSAIAERRRRRPTRIWCTPSGSRPSSAAASLTHQCCRQARRSCRRRPPRWHRARAPAAAPSARAAARRRRTRSRAATCCGSRRAAARRHRVAAPAGTRPPPGLRELELELGDRQALPAGLDRAEVEGRLDQAAAVAVAGLEPAHLTAHAGREDRSQLVRLDQPVQRLERAGRQQREVGLGRAERRLPLAAIGDEAAGVVRLERLDVLTAALAHAKGEAMAAAADPRCRSRCSRAAGPRGGRPAGRGSPAARAATPAPPACPAA